MLPQFYRREALRFRLLAREEKDPEHAEQLRRWAVECDEIAAELERIGIGPEPHW